MNIPARVNVCEVGPRDGLQNEDKVFSAETKAELINDIIDAGYKIIEIGSFVHPKAVPALADTEEVFKMVNKDNNVEFRALVTNLIGIERAIDAGISKVKLTISASESHNLSNFNKKPEETLKDFEECYKYAIENGLEVSAAISTSFGCPFEGNISIDKIEKIILKIREIGIREISLSDTTGMANPTEVYKKFSYVKEQYPDIKWNAHFHNTRDVAMANTLAAIQAGVYNFDASFSGLGGCPYAPGASGNLSSEDLVHMLEEMDIDTGVNLDKAINLARKVKKLVGHDTESYMLRAGKVDDLIEKHPDGQQKLSD